ncbi:MAG: [LysW]-aminoadipate kinase [Candidatus Diapherotrites archaeon]
MLTVIKLGGGKGIDPGFLLDEIAAMKGKFILVHGASHELNELQQALGIPVETITSPSGFTSRRTTREVIELFEMAYCGKANKALVEGLQKRGVNAIGLSGIDGMLLTAKRNTAIKSAEGGKTKIIRDDLSGKPETANTTLLSSLLETGYVPVICPPAIAEGGIAVNVDGDLAAAVIAGKMNASALVFLSNVPGILREVGNNGSLIKKIRLPEFENSMKEFAKGRMKKKLLAAKIAIESGVEKVAIAGANTENPMANALNGVGTCITE